MTYKYLTQYTTPNKWPGQLEADSITVHWWGKPASHSGQIAGVVSWLCNSAAKASAHFVASATDRIHGRVVAQLATLDDATWHSGNGTGNRTSVSIEMSPDMTADDLELCAELVALIWHWRPKTRNKALRPHRYWIATECPGTYLDQLAWIAARARYYYPLVDPDRPGHLKAKPAPAPAPAPDKTEELDMDKAELQQMLDQLREDINRDREADRNWSISGRTDSDRVPVYGDGRDQSGAEDPDGDGTMSLPFWRRWVMLNLNTLKADVAAIRRKVGA